MLTYNLNKSNQALYLQLYENIKNDIIKNNLKENERLPSKRKLANHLGIALITVENAYEQLIAEGYIYAIEKKGYFVNESLDNAFQMIETNNLKKTKKTVINKNNYIDINTLDVDISLFPFSIWSKLMRQVLSNENKKLLIRTDSFGIIELREAIAKHLYSFHGINISLEQIIIGSGSEYLYSMIIKLLGFDKKYALENPCYNKIANVYEINNTNIEYINLDSMGIDIKKLNNIDVVHISPAHQFPSGIVMPIQRKIELLRWADKDKNRYIIEDDYDSAFRFKGLSIASLSSIDKKDNVIYINTFSKTIAPSIRISYMIIPKKLVKTYKEKLGFFSCPVPSFEQYTLSNFINGGYFERHLNKLKTYYKKKKDIFFNIIKESKLNSISSIIYKDSGLHFLLKIDTNIDDSVLINKAFEKNVKISTLSQYYRKQNNVNKHILVINFSSISEKNFRYTIEILENILN